ncbi:MAG: NHL repeat-containing protein [Candidatus Aminicenantes bacterium]|nr:NHL repeat-containing protein [Candidatus Aminicenantes bacterium]
MKKKINLLVIVFFLFSYWLNAAGIKEIKNSLPEVKHVMDNIQLKTVRTWGAEDEGGDENYFKAPGDIAVDKDNNVYIVDSTLHCVKVFSMNGRFIRKIGQRGQGPGDLLSPMQIAVDESNRIWVNDFGNRRMQCFSNAGTSMSIFKTSMFFLTKIFFPSKTKIALFDMFASGSDKGIIKIFNRSGVKLQTIGANVLPPRIDRPFNGGKFDSHRISYDKIAKQYYVAYTCSQMMHVFRDTGEHIATIFYDTPVNKLKLAWNQKKRNFDLIKRPGKYSECVDIAVDSKRRIFVIITSRLLKNNEKVSGKFVDGRISYKPQVKEYPEKTDLYWLLVFGDTGKIIASKQLDVFCSGIYLHNNHLFIVDKVFEKVIYEYRYTIDGQ